MTTEQRACATDTLMSADATKDRIRQWCEWFDLPVPKVKTRKDKVYLTDELYAWMNDAGANFDWIFCGDMKGMASSYRKEIKGQRRFMRAVKQLDENESRILQVCMQSTVDGAATIDDAIAAMQVAIAEYRTGKPFNQQEAS